MVGRSIRNNMNYYYLDDGVYGDFSGLVFDHSHYEFKALKRTPKFLSVLAGPTCDSFDTIATRRRAARAGSRRRGLRAEHRRLQLCQRLTFNGIPPAKVIVV